MTETAMPPAAFTDEESEVVRKALGDRREKLLDDARRLRTSREEQPCEPCRRSAQRMAGTYEAEAALAASALSKLERRQGDDPT